MPITGYATGKGYSKNKANWRLGIKTHIAKQIVSCGKNWFQRSAKNLVNNKTHRHRELEQITFPNVAGHTR